MRQAVKNLHPASFAMVMSTGIVSIAFKRLEINPIATTLFALNIVIYIVLLSMLIARILFFKKDFLEDLKQPKKGFVLLTFVAGTNIFGVQLFLFNLINLAQALWFLGIISWILMIYFIYINLIAFRNEPLEKIVDGAMLLTTVSTQSIAVLGSNIAKYFGAKAELVLFVSWVYWAAGFMLYLLVITLVLYRLLFRKLAPKDWTGPYWICMGAAAITTLAGSNLALNMQLYVHWQEILAATKVITLVAWSIGTWWIPILLFMDWWMFLQVNITGKSPLWIKLFPWARLGFGRKLHFYDHSAWGRVFPLGMYTVCTIMLTKATAFDFLYVIPKYWGWFALMIWSLTFMGMLRSILAFFIRTKNKESALLDN